MLVVTILPFRYRHKVGDLLRQSKKITTIVASFSCVIFQEVLVKTPTTDDAGHRRPWFEPTNPSISDASLHMGKKRSPANRTDLYITWNGHWCHDKGIL